MPLVQCGIVIAYRRTLVNDWIPVVILEHDTTQHNGCNFSPEIQQTAREGFCLVGIVEKARPHAPSVTCLPHFHTLDSVQLKHDKSCLLTQKMAKRWVSVSLARPLCIPNPSPKHRSKQSPISCFANCPLTSHPRLLPRGGAAGLPLQHGHAFNGQAPSMPSPTAAARLLPASRRHRCPRHWFLVYLLVDNLPL
jgi:hypothetical protein